MQQAPIFYFDRTKQCVEREQVYGEKWLRWAYETLPGRACLWAFIRRPFFSRWYGRRMSAPASRAKIAPFVEKFGVNLAECEKSLESFSSFNDFFYRKLKPDARPIESREDAAVFGANGRHSALAPIGKGDTFFLKGQSFDLAKLLGDAALARKYEGGVLVLSRLCPVDYHRFHFPCSGVPSKSVLIGSDLYSVSPIALRRRLAYLWENRRMRTELQTERFGKVQILEIGATNVGSIFQTFHPGQPVKKGQEKGYFAFGGSAVATLFEPGKIQLAVDLLEQGAQGRELYAPMGSRMGLACPR